MKYLGSPGLRRRRRLLRKFSKPLGVTVVAAFAAVLFSAYQSNRDDAEPAATQAHELVLPGHKNALRHPLVDGQRLPFEPMVARRNKTKPAPAEADEAGTWTNVTVAPGDNLSLIFSRLKLSKSDLHHIVSLPPAGSQLKRLKPGQLVRFQIHDAKLTSMVLELDDLNSLTITRDGTRFTAKAESIEPEIRVASATAEIRRSLFLDGQKAGLSDAMIMRMTEIFGWDIDFALDIRARDSFSVIYEEAYKDGELIKQGRILAAEFVNQGKSLRAILFTDENGETEYYSDEGQAMRKAFLRTPVNFTRISSRFNLRRKHPVLNTIRAHRGVDYAAPMGTPVRATANGKIVMVGTRGGYGKTVEMQHGNTYSTLYAHLSRFPKGLRRGASVKQGKIIGYVGKSGLATGPHLHYEFRVNGAHRNPLTVDLPKAQHIEKRYLAEFRQQAEPLLDQLATLTAEHRKPASNIVARLDLDER